MRVLALNLSDELKANQTQGGAFALLQSTNDGTPSMAAILQSAAVGGYVVISVNEAMQTGSAIARTATLTYAAK